MAGQPFTRLTAVAVPILRDNVNTDAIIPSREMKLVSRRGLADGLFADWRYTSVGGRDPDPSFPLNQARFAGAAILLAGSNFGCGSSREHAAWALVEFGFRAVLAESFNPIFRANAVLNGIVPVQLPRPALDALAAGVEAGLSGPTLTVDLVNLEVSSQGGERFAFGLDDEAREMLLEGLDAIALTQKREAEIRAFRIRDEAARPWAYR